MRPGKSCSPRWAIFIQRAKPRARSTLIRFRNTSAVMAAIVLASALSVVVGCVEEQSADPSPSVTVEPSIPSSLSPSTIAPGSTSAATVQVVEPTTVEIAGSSSTLFDFTADASTDWYVQNDTVMGGVSSSSVRIEQGEMVFSGNVSLDNNGGFASVRSPIFGTAPDREGNALAIDSTGDGRTYLVQILTPTDSYITRFVPVEGSEVRPFSDFSAASWRLDPIPAVAPLTAESIGQIAFYVLDKQVGEFVLRVRSISIIDM